MRHGTQKYGLTDEIAHRTPSVPVPAPVLDTPPLQNRVSALGWGQHIDEALRAMVLCETVCNVPVWAQALGKRMTVNADTACTARERSAATRGRTSDLT